MQNLMQEIIPRLYTRQFVIINTGYGEWHSLTVQFSLIIVNNENEGWITESVTAVANQSEAGEHL